MSTRSINRPFSHPILFFDGDCSFCQGWVQFVLKRDKRQLIYFAPIQGETYQNLESHQKIQKSQALAKDGTIIYLRNNNLLFRSDAVISLLRDLKGLWSLMAIFLLIPRPLRDYVYTWIAINRGKLPAPNKKCPLPKEGQLKRLLP